MDEEYEILPKDELDYLRKEVEKLKKNPYGETETGKTLLDSMQELTNSINKLISLFQSTQKELIEEYAKSNPTETLSEILDQNEKIAKGTLAVADLIKKQQESIDEIKDQVKPESQVNASNNQQNIPGDQQMPDFNKQTNPSLGNAQQSPNQNPFGSQKMPEFKPQQNSSMQNPFDTPFQSNNPNSAPPIPEPSQNYKKKKGLFHKK